MRWLMLPLSIGSHVLAATALLVVPLAAEVSPPAPASLHQVLVTKLMPVPADAVALATPRRTAPARSFSTPAAIGPERPNPEPGNRANGDAPPVAGERVNEDWPGGIGDQIALPGPAMPAPPARAVPAPLRVGQGVREPRKIVDVRPIYPEIAMRARVQGAVILEAVIDERGAVDRIKVLRSSPLLDAAAIDAVRQWRYTPTLVNGAPVAVLITITFNFTLNR